MEGSFNPYAEWLGIAHRGGRPNYYALLGLKVFESDPAKIAAAAERRVAALTRIQAGPREPIRQQLLAELERAKQTLTDTAHKQRYDERLREKSAPRPATKPSANTPAAKEPSKSTQEQRRTSAAELLPPRAGFPSGPPLPTVPSNVDPMAPVTPTSASDNADTPPRESMPESPPAVPTQPLHTLISEIDPPAALISDQLASARLSARKLAVRRQKAPYWVIAAMLVLLVVVAGGLAVGFATGLIRFGPTASVSERESDDFYLPLPRASDEEPVPFDDLNPPTGDDLTSGQPTVDRPKKRDEPIKPQDTDTVANSKPAASDTAAKPTEPSVDPAQQKRFKAALAAARTALGAKNTTDATKHIKAAGELATSDEQKELVAGAQELAKSVDEFWKAVDEGLKGLEEAGELKVGSTIVSVVEVTKERLVIRANGQNRRYPLSQLPAGIAVAIANKRFDEQPDNKLHVGAFYFVDPRTDVAEAKRLWEEAAGAGVDVKRLLALLPIAAETM